MNRTLAVSFCVAAILTLGAGSAKSADDKPALRPLDAWTNVFAGEPVVLRYGCRFESDDPVKIAWTLSAGNQQVLDRGSIDVVEANKAEPIAVRCKMPLVRDELVMPVELTVAMFSDSSAEPLAVSRKKFRCFPRDPFAEQKEWLKGLHIALYDPPGATARLFDKAKIPYARFAVLPTEGHAANAVIWIVGEGISWSDFPGLPDNLLAAASQGRPVLCMAAAAGELPLPAPGDQPMNGRLLLENSRLIADLDSRLDAIAWPPDGHVASRALRLTAAEGAMQVKVAQEPQGWIWLEQQFTSGGRLMVCQCEIVKHWDAGPAPRYLLARILERLSGGNKGQDGIPAKLDEIR